MFCSKKGWMNASQGSSQGEGGGRIDPFVTVFWMHASMYTCIPGACAEQRKVLNFLELELWMLWSSQVGAGNWTRVLCRSSKCSVVESFLELHTVGLLSGSHEWSLRAAYHSSWLYWTDRAVLGSMQGWWEEVLRLAAHKATSPGSELLL